MNPQKPILVVAGIIQKNERILICQRHRSDAYGMQWEFPGGKVEDGEALPEALRRELAEELGIQVDVGEEVHRLRHVYPDRYVEVVFFTITDFRGEVSNNVFEAVELGAAREPARIQLSGSGPRTGQAHCEGGNCLTAIFDW